MSWKRKGLRILLLQEPLTQTTIGGICRARNCSISSKSEETQRKELAGGNYWAGVIPYFLNSSGVAFPCFPFITMLEFKGTLDRS